MYKNLKFSWAHILAFLALIFMGYVTFVGLTYDIDDGFMKPVFITLGILIVLILWFIGAQQLKGTDNNYDFRKCIWIERILLFSTPIVFVLCMIPFNHAMNVAKQADVIEMNFKNAISASSELFLDYEVYAEKRIENYAAFLNRVKANRNLQPSLYDEIGFSGEHDDERIKIEVQTLNRQLIENYNELKSLATAWIERANQKTSVWNVFLIGNIKQIDSAIVDWSNSLTDFSKVILSTEKLEDTPVIPFDADKEHINLITSKLDSLRKIYNPPHDTRESLNLRTVILGVFLYLLLLFPYFIQERNGVSTYTLFGRRFMHQGIDMSGVYGRNAIDKNIISDKISEELNENMQRNFAGESIEDDVDGGNMREYPEQPKGTEALTKEERRKRRLERREARNNNGNQE